MLLLFASLTFAADVDIAPSGTIVTVRPEPGERATIISGETSCEIEDLPDAVPPMWLVHPESWRKAVAVAEETAVLRANTKEQADILAGLRVDLGEEQSLRSQLQLDLQSEKTLTQQLRRSRTQWLVGGLVTGAALSAAGIGVIVL